MTSAADVESKNRPERPLKLLHVITDDDRRGAQVFASDLDRQLRILGQDSRVVALTSSTGALDVETLGPTRTSLTTLAAIRRRARSFDVVCAHGSTTLPMCMLATAGTPTPVIYRQISDPLYWAGTPLRRIRTAAFLHMTKRIVALDEHLIPVLIRHYGLRRSRISIIPNGVEQDQFKPATSAQSAAAKATFGLDPANRVVLFVGALVPEKGADLAIDAIAGEERATLMIMGDGPERKTLESRAKRSRADIRFLGTVREPITAYHAADLVVLPSRGGDTMPAVLIEAALCGLPIVSTAVGAIPTLVVHGQTGLIVEPNPTAMRLAMNAATPAMGSAGRAHALEHFTIDTVADRWIQACVQVVYRCQGKS